VPDRREFDHRTIVRYFYVLERLNRTNVRCEDAHTAK